MSAVTAFSSAVWRLYTDLAVSHPLYGAVVGLVCGYAGLRTAADIAKNILKKVMTLRKKKNNPRDPKYDPEVLYLHMFFRRMTKKVPNLSPFAIKVETWLRLKNIPYEPVETRIFSNATRQIPYLNHRGEEVTDSDFIIEYVEKHFSLDPNEGLDGDQLGAARGLTKMVEESLSGTYFMHRYITDIESFRRVWGTPFQSRLGAYIFTRIFKKIFAYYWSMRGIGRKTTGEIYHIGDLDVRALSQYLGDKPFMMGDSMTKVDCAVFGQLCQIICVSPEFRYPHMDVIETECSNLIGYVHRIKDKCWPDWDDIVHSGVFQ